MKSFFKLPQSNESVDEWFSLGRFAALLGVLMALMFHQVLLGLETFFIRDYGTFGYPLAHHVSESLRSGQIPFWNPLNNCGLPFLAQWNTMVLYPPSLFYVIFPVSWALGVFCLGHMYVGGLGMYLLAHRWTGNRLAASLAGLVFAVNGFTWHSLTWPNNIAAFALLPWVVWSIDRAWSSGGRAVVVAGLIGALQMLSGAPEIIVLTWGFVGLLWLVHGRRGEDGSEWGGWANIARSAGVIGIVTGVAAIQLLPFLDLLGHSHRESGYAGMDWAMPGLGWANFLVPLFHTYPSFYGGHVQHEQYWTTSYYVGVAVVVMAVWTAWKVSDRRARLLVAMSAVCLVLALGEDGLLLTWLHGVVPQLSFMRFPIKFVVLVIFAIPLLAAFAVAQIRKESERRPIDRSLIATSAAILALMGVIVWCAHAYPLADNDWTATWKNAVGRMGFLVVGVGLLLCTNRLKKPEVRLACSVALLVAAWADVRTHTPNINPTVDRQVYAAGLVRTYAEFDPQPVHGAGRARVTAESLREMRHRAVDSPENDFLGRRLALFGNCNLLDGIPKLDGGFSLYLREADEILDPLRYASGSEADALISFLNVSQSTSPGKLMDWSPRQQFQKFVTGGQNPVYADYESIGYVVGQSQFEPDQVVLLPLEAAGVVRATNRTEVEISHQRVTAHEIEFQVEAADRALVTISQSYYHPWKAYVDGVPTTLWRGNHAFQTLEVAKGKHQVRIVYEDKKFALGAVTTLMTLLGCGLFWRRSRTPSSDP